MMNKKDNTLFYVLAVILVFVLISWMKDKNKKDKTTNTTTEKEPDLVDPVTGDNVYLPDDYDPTTDAPPVVAGGGITATVPDNQQTTTVNSDTHSGAGGHFAISSYTI